MMTTNRAPRGLGRAGRALHRAITSACDLNEAELLGLAEAARLADLAADLEASARQRGLTYQAVAEVRKLRSTVAGMVRDLTPPPADSGPSASDVGRALARRRSQWNRADAERQTNA